MIGDVARALGYARQSLGRDHETAETSLSLDAQERELRTYATRSDLALIAVIRDHDLTGDNPNRPGLLDLVARVKAGEARTVLVHKWDRLARDLLLQESIIRPLESIGVRFVSVTEPGDRLGRVLFGAIAEHHKQQLSDRLTGVFAERARRGLHHGQPPYGFRKVLQEREGKLVGILEPDPDQVPTVLYIFDRYLAGETLWGIAEDLLARGIPSGKGAGWAAHAVKHVLLNPAVVGDVRYGGKVVARDAHAPIVDRATFAAAQDRLARFPVVKRKPRQWASWCEGLVIHSCGERMYLTGIYRPTRGKHPIPTFGCRGAYSQSARRCHVPRRHLVSAKLERAARLCLAVDLGRVVPVERAWRYAEAEAGGRDVQQRRQTLVGQQRRLRERRARAEALYLDGLRDRAWFQMEDAELDTALTEVETALNALPTTPDRASLQAKAEQLQAIGPQIMAASDDALRELLTTIGVLVVSADGVTVRYIGDYRHLIPKPITIQVPTGRTEDWRLEGS